MSLSTNDTLSILTPTFPSLLNRIYQAVVFITEL